MDFTINHIHEQAIWDNTFNQFGSPSFHQDWAWGEFEQLRGHEVLRLGIYRQTTLIGITQVVKMRVKRGSFLFVPHGPVLQDLSDLQQTFTALRDYLLDVAKRERFTFIRMAPAIADSRERRAICKSLGFKRAAIFIHAERSWLLDIMKPDGQPVTEEALLAQMRKTTRYSIKKATKAGVTIEQRTDTQAVAEFYALFTTTVQRQQFAAYSRQYIADEFAVFNQAKRAVFLFARLPGEAKPLAAALILFTKSSAFYHQGASVHHKVPAPYLLQWEAVKEAQRRGCRLYNFYGIAHNDKPNHPWAGLTLFKTGFGGRVLDYIPTQDYPVSPAYYLTRGYEKLLRWRRGV